MIKWVPTDCVESLPVEKGYALRPQEIKWFAEKSHKSGKGQDWNLNSWLMTSSTTIHNILFSFEKWTDMSSSASNCRIISLETFYRQRHWVCNLTADWNHLGSFKNNWYLGPPPLEIRFDWGGGQREPGHWDSESFPGAYDVQPSLRITVQRVSAVHTQGETRGCLHFWGAPSLALSLLPFSHHHPHPIVVPSLDYWWCQWTSSNKTWLHFSFPPEV